MPRPRASAAASAAPPAAIAPEATLDAARAAFDAMEAPPAPAPPPRAPRRAPAAGDASADVYYLRDDETARKYRVEYLHGAGGKLARVRGRVALTLQDLPPAMRRLPKVSAGGGYAHVYERRLALKELTDDARTTWYQPMFKKRWTEVDEATGEKRRGVTWFARMGSYWDDGVAAVAAEMGLARHAEGQSREQIEKVEEDIVEAARQFKTRGKAPFKPPS